MKNNTHELFRSLVRDFFELNISSDSFSELREIAISEAMQVFLNCRLIMTQTKRLTNQRKDF
jgi:histone H3/H4